MNTYDSFLENLIEKLKIWGLFAILILVPICYSSGEIRQFQERAFVMSAMTYASLYFGCAWMTLFFVFNMLMFLWNGAQIGSAQVFNIFVGCLLFAVSRSFFSDKKITILTNAFKFLLILNLAYMYFQVFSIDPIFIGQDGAGRELWGQSFNAPSGLFNLKAATGMFFVLTMPFLFSVGWTIPILLLFPIFLERSAACYVASAAMILYGAFYIRMVTFRRKVIYWLIFFFIAFLGVVGTIHDYKDDRLTGLSRFESWHMILKQSLTKPIFGHGPDSFRNITPHKKFKFFADESYNPILMDYSNPEKVVARYHSADEGKRIERFRGKTPEMVTEWQEAHNEYLQVFFEYGFVGIFLISALIYEIYRRFKISIDDKSVRILFGALICYAIFSIVQFPFHLTRIALFFPVILGAFFAKTDNDWDIFVKGRA